MINFLRTPTANYALVQEHILGLIKAHLKPEEYTETIGERAQDALNFSLFIDARPDVLMSHGIADKNYFWRKDQEGKRIVDGIKHCLVPGRWLHSRIVKHKALNHTKKTVHRVGWPRLDELFRLQVEYDAKTKEKGARPRVLWAPTHDYARRGADLVTMSSYPGFLECLPLLEKHADVMTSLHPRNRKEKRPTMEQLIEADVVISDFGTMVYEAWALAKPVIFPDWIVRAHILEFLKRGVTEKYIYEENIGIHTNSIDELIDAVHTQEKPDQKTLAFVDDYIDPKYKGTSAARIAKVLRKLDAEQAGQVERQ